MANYNSDNITNLDLNPAEYPDTTKSGALTKLHDQKAITGGEAQGTTITLFIPGQVRDGQYLDKRECTVTSPAMGASVTMDIGIVGNSTAFKSAVDVSSAATTTFFTAGDDPFYSVDADEDFQVLLTLSGASVGSGAKTIYVDLGTFRGA